MRKLLVVWLVGWALFGLPWTTFTVRPRFDHLSLVPFQRTRRRDQLLNFAYYAPFGIIGVLQGWPGPSAAAAAAVLSGATELAQLFSTERVTSITDLFLNVAGAVVGIAIGMVLRARQKPA